MHSSVTNIFSLFKIPTLPQDWRYVGVHFGAQFKRAARPFGCSRPLLPLPIGDLFCIVRTHCCKVTSWFFPLLLGHSPLTLTVILVWDTSRELGWTPGHPVAGIDRFCACADSQCRSIWCTLAWVHPTWIKPEVLTSMCAPLATSGTLKVNVDTHPAGLVSFKTIANTRFSLVLPLGWVLSFFLSFSLKHLTESRGLQCKRRLRSPQATHSLTPTASSFNLGNIQVGSTSAGCWTPFLELRLCHAKLR